MNSKISIIIPFLNEEENIPFLTESLNSYFSSNKEYETEVLFVNDGSTDNSVEVLKKQKHKVYDCKIISLSKNFGSHAALRAGILTATGTHICFMYADLQDPLNLIDKLFEESKKDNDICWATREETESGFIEKTFSKTYSYMMQKYAISTYPEKGFDIVMFNKKVQSQINQNIEANSSIFLQIRKKIKLFVDSFVAFSYAPIRFVTVIGILLFFLGLLWSAYLIIRKLVHNDLDSGWPALVSILMLGFGITNISLGIIAEYLWRTLDSSRKRPVFIINDIVEINKQ
jgi:dolichol-phosphate mannosyltransferase